LDFRSRGVDALKTADFAQEQISFGRPLAAFRFNVSLTLNRKGADSACRGRGPRLTRRGNQPPSLGELAAILTELASGGHRPCGIPYRYTPEVTSTSDLLRALQR